MTAPPTKLCALALLFFAAAVNAIASNGATQNLAQRNAATKENAKDENEKDDLPTVLWMQEDPTASDSAIRFELTDGIRQAQFQPPLYPLSPITPRIGLPTTAASSPTPGLELASLARLRNPFDAARPNVVGTGWLGNNFLSSTRSAFDSTPPTLSGVTAAFLEATRDAPTMYRDIPGVDLGRRSSGQNELNMRGQRRSQSIGEGSYWFPARQDLDTMLSKIDSRIIQDVAVIKGPYSALYGPGLSFYSVNLLDTPRYASGFESHGSSTVEYETNGEQWHGRQAFHGGSTDWGYRVGYGHRTGNDYETGDGVGIPSSYKSRIIDLSLGADLTGDDNLEFHALRLDQTDVELPNAFFDINFLVTDAYEFAYTSRDTTLSDSVAVEAWYNRTRLEGDNSRSGKRRLLGTIGEIIVHSTDVDAMSTGYRAALNWDDTVFGDLSVGTDLRYLSQQLNEANSLLFFFVTDRSAIPRSHLSNPGLFWETTRQPHESVFVRAGGRVDWVSTNADNSGNVITANGRTIEEHLLGDLNQHFKLWTLFASSDVALTNCWTLTVAAGHSERPPTLTELYTANFPFFSPLPQWRGASSQGDPNLRPEQIWQVDIGLAGDLGKVSTGLNGFYAWVTDYVTVDALDNGAVYAYTNTNLATLSGFDAFFDVELDSWLTAFGAVSFVEGRDRTRNATVSTLRASGLAPGRGNSTTDRSDATTDREPLPVIPPLEGRVGFVIREPETSLWSAEFSLRLADSQDRVATSLFEEPTEAFAVFDIRGYARVRKDLYVTGGVLNVTDEEYRTYSDSRGVIPGLEIFPVFRPGVSFYFGAEFIR